MRKNTLIRKRQIKLVVDKEILKLFPEPDRMGQPVPTRWGKPSIVQSNPKEKQVLRNSY